MYGLDLFSGIGGITKALEGYVQPIAYCEIDRYAQAVLLSRMAKGDLPVAPIWDDVRSLRGNNFARKPDIIYGGFPCQDISVAGRGAGLAGERSGLFFEIARLAGEIRPPFIFLENVPAVTTRGGLRILAELESLRYDCRWGILSAADVGANHRRERWWLLAHAAGVERRAGTEEPGEVPAVLGDKRIDDYADRPGPALAYAAGADGGLDSTERGHSAKSRRETEAPGMRGGQVALDVAHADQRENRRLHGRSKNQTQTPEPSGRSQNVAHPDRTGRGKQRRPEPIRPELSSAECRGENLADATLKRGVWRLSVAGEKTRGRPHAETERHGWWAVEPAVGRLVDGLPFRVDMLRALGNSVVPAQAREAFERLMGL